MLTEQEKASFRITQEALQDPTLNKLNRNFEFLGELIGDTQKKLEQVNVIAGAAIPWAEGSPAQAGKHTDRLAVHPEDMGAGFLFYETDRKSLYQVQFVFPGRLDIVWIGGCYFAPLAQIPTDLKSIDRGFLFSVTDYGHVLRWTGTGWEWGPGELGSGYMVMRMDAPSPMTGWVECDGSEVTRLNSDGTTSDIIICDFSTAAFPKIGATYDGYHAAVMPKIKGEADNQTDDNTTTVSAGSDGAAVSVPTGDHFHTAHNEQPADTHPIPWVGVPKLYYRL